MSIYPQLAERKPEALLSNAQQKSQLFGDLSPAKQGVQLKQLYETHQEEVIETIHPLGVLEPSLSERGKQY